MYATQHDMILAFGERECRNLCDPEMTGQIDEAVMAAALTRASAEIDGYLVGRYATPWPDTPRILVGRCCDIARYHLTTAHRVMSDEIRQRYEDAIRFLEKVAAGQISLGRADNGQIIQSTPQMAFGSSPRQFGRDATGGGAF
ncbi:phage protein Gp36 family protein [Xenorhabdus nematophila]|uniref:gp436 family protein n=1 Tax=Xenorhabdus nematophila TaxID=628 RepID=UPI0032B70655